MVRPLLKQMVVAEVAATVPVTPDDCSLALQRFMQDQNLETEEDLRAFLRLNLLHRHELEQQLVQPWRVQSYVTDR